MVWKAAKKAVFALLVAVLMVLSFYVGSASAWAKEPTLSLVSSVFAMRSVSVRCFSADEQDSPRSYGAWGYVKNPLARSRYSAIDGTLCDAALDLDNRDVAQYTRALAVLVLIHEAYHLRRWGGAGDEGKVECKAIRHWKTGARFLGASAATVSELWPMALAIHAEQASYVDWLTGERPYDDPDCRVPPIKEDE